MARAYFEDGTAEALCPPLRVLVTIMATGSFEGMDETHPDVRAMFERDAILDSDWYRERLAVKQTREVERWTRHAGYVARRAQEQSEVDHGFGDDAIVENQAREAHVARQLERVRSPEYLQSLFGTVGAESFATE